MKPYALVVYNKMRFAVLKLCVPSFAAKGIHLLSYSLKLRCHKTAQVTFGDRIVSDGRMVIIVGENAELTIGNHVYFNEDAMISCKGKVHIGDGCKFGPNVKVFDNNHKFDSVTGVQETHSVGEVRIGSGCWLGSNVVILKDTHIGDHCVIGAGCVVTGQIPDNSVVTMGRDLNIEPMRVGNL